MANPTPQDLAKLKQQHVLAVLTAPYYSPKGIMDAEKLCTIVGIQWRGRQARNGKEGAILGTAETFVDWFVDQGLITKEKKPGNGTG